MTSTAVAGAAQEGADEAPMRLTVKVALVLLGVAVIVLWLRGSIRPASIQLFKIQADAFLHGHLDLGRVYPDTALFGGRTFIPLGPLPALLMVPLEAIGGPAANEVWLEVVSLALTIPTLSALFRELGFEAVLDRALLTVASICGSTYVAALTLNSSYYVASLVVVALLSMALLRSLQGRQPLLCGLLVGLAAMTRAPALLALVPVAVLQASAHPQRRAQALALVTAAVVPSLVVVAVFNQLRFGTPFESGYGLQTLLFPPLRAARAQGLFSAVHLPKNLYYFLLSPPAVNGGENAPVVAFPWLHPSDWGTGVVWLSPWVLWGLAARGRRAAVLAGGVLLIVLPSLFYYGIGWIQFGYRYALDALPFMAALAAVGLRRTNQGTLFRAAVGYSVIVNLLGAAWLIARVY